MHRLRLWLDRQLVETSWPHGGVSPPNRVLFGGVGLSLCKLHHAAFAAILSVVESIPGIPVC